MLQAAGLPQEKVPEQWNLEQPDQVRALHRAYLDAGSQIILSNTFGGTRIKMDRAGCGDLVVEANHAAARLAKEMAGNKAFVAGDIGPCGELLAPYGSLTHEDAVAAFAEQAKALDAGGVDCLWVETMTALEEMQAALAGAKQASDLPIFCTMSFGPGGRTMMGVSPERAIQTLWSQEVAACGANCGQGPETMAAVVGDMAATQPDAVLIAKPNAGLPKLVDGEQVYDMPPETMAEYLLVCVDAGARIVGACCGSTPDHIRALVARLQLADLWTSDQGGGQ
jgi:5-methyltetrahydrofolate--homocysteine methyltransferase